MNFLTRNARFVYLIAGLCSLYMALVPLLSGGHGSTLFIGFRIGAVLLLSAAIIPGERCNIVLNVVALGGSTLITAILLYDIARFGALRFGFLRGSVRIVVDQPNAFDRVRQILTMPVLIILVISSVASLLMSALITVHLRRPGLRH